MKCKHLDMLNGFNMQFYVFEAPHNNSDYYSQQKKTLSNGDPSQQWPGL